MWRVCVSLNTHTPARAVGGEDKETKNKREGKKKHGRVRLKHVSGNINGNKTMLGVKIRLGGGSDEGGGGLGAAGHVVRRRS